MIISCAPCLRKQKQKGNDTKSKNGKLGSVGSFVGSAPGARVLTSKPRPLSSSFVKVDAIRLQANLIRRHGGPNRTLTEEEHPAVPKLGYFHPGLVGEDELIDEYVHDPFAASQLQTEPHGEQVPAGLHQADPEAPRQPRRDGGARGRENRAPRRREL